MLNESLLSEMCAFASKSGYKFIGGSFNAVLESPPEYQLVGRVEIVVNENGRYLIWHVDPITEMFTGLYDDGDGPMRLKMSRKTSLEDKQAALRAINSRVCQ